MNSSDYFFYWKRYSTKEEEYTFFEKVDNDKCYFICLNDRTITYSSLSSSKLLTEIDFNYCLPIAGFLFDYIRNLASTMLIESNKIASRLINKDKYISEIGHCYGYRFDLVDSSLYRIFKVIDPALKRKITVSKSCICIEEFKNYEYYDDDTMDLPKEKEVDSTIFDSIDTLNKFTSDQIKYLIEYNNLKKQMLPYPTKKIWESSFDGTCMEHIIREI